MNRNASFGWLLSGTIPLCDLLGLLPLDKGCQSCLKLVDGLRRKGEPPGMMEPPRAGGETNVADSGRWV